MGSDVRKACRSDYRDSGDRPLDPSNEMGLCDVQTRSCLSCCHDISKRQQRVVLGLLLVCILNTCSFVTIRFHFISLQGNFNKIFRGIFEPFWQGQYSCKESIIILCWIIPFRMGFKHLSMNFNMKSL